MILGRPRFHTLRDRLTAVAVLVAAVAIAALTLAFNLLLASGLHGDIDNRLRTQAAAAATTVGVRGDRLVLRESANDDAVDRRTWIYQGRRAIERPSGSSELQRAADALAGRSDVFVDLRQPEVRLYASPITDEGRRLGTVVAAQSLAAYDRTTDVALLASGVLGVVLLGAVLLLTRSAVGRALGPVREMTHAAGEWSEHEPERRFGAQSRPDELGELARTFDGLLDRVAAGLRHEQRLSAELSHELRTPLSRIVAEIELLARRDRPYDERRESYGSIARSADQMSGILETLMAAARADAGLDRGRCDLAGALDDLKDTWDPVLAADGVALEVERPARREVVGVDADVLERIVAPVLENARRFARGRVRVVVRPGTATVRLEISDDGPGIPADALERVFEPGARLPAADGDANGHKGSGLGLPLARRLARAAHGDVSAEAGAPGAGARFVVLLPR
jgi:signal transduction histidine kinase